MFERAYPVHEIDEFRMRLLDNCMRLKAEVAEPEFAIPVGLFLVLDESNGGDATAAELQRRFRFLDLESRDVIDFYFLGWRLGVSSALEFDLDSFQKKICRRLELPQSMDPEADIGRAFSLLMMVADEYGG